MQPIFVGDVQGCADELAEVAARARSDFADTHHLFVVGDLVNRGPGNLAVLRLLRDLQGEGRATVILGNLIGFESRWSCRQ